MNNSKKITAARAILAAACIALGVVLIVHPGFTGIVICRTAGALALAFGAARGEYNCISWTLENLTKYVVDRGLESYTLETHGLRITQEVEQEGYEAGGYLLFAEEEADTYLHWVFTIERV